MENAEALRVTGYLLERRGTRGAFASRTHSPGGQTTLSDPEACWFCLAGALLLVGQVCQGRGEHDFWLCYAAAERLGIRAVHEPFGSLVNAWDSASVAEQRQMIARLKTTGL
jgi:hypothetical protein